MASSCAGWDRFPGCLASRPLFMVGHDALGVDKPFFVEVPREHHGACGGGRTSKVPRVLVSRARIFLNSSRANAWRALRAAGSLRGERLPVCVEDLMPRQFVKLMALVSSPTGIIARSCSPFGSLPDLVMNSLAWKYGDSHFRSKAKSQAPSGPCVISLQAIWFQCRIFDIGPNPQTARPGARVHEGHKATCAKDRL